MNRHESMSPLKNLSPDCIESTMIVLTPIRASKSQREKHKCDMILSPVRKSTRLMKYNHEELVGDKLIGTTYAYANNKNIANKPVDCSSVCNKRNTAACRCTPSARGWTWPS